MLIHGRYDKQIPEDTVVQLSGILERMEDRINVRLHLIGHADNQPLSQRLVEIYGDNEGLSRERAGQVAQSPDVFLGAEGLELAAP